MRCLQLYPVPSRGHVYCRVATPSLLQAPGNVALVVVCLALMALAWRDATPGRAPSEPFARLLCNVALTALDRNNRNDRNQHGVYQDPYS